MLLVCDSVLGEADETDFGLLDPLNSVRLLAPALPSVNYDGKGVKTSRLERLRKRERSSYDIRAKDKNGIERSELLLELPDDGYMQCSKKRKQIVEVPLATIRPPPLAFPKSLYYGHEPSTSPVSELSVLKAILVGGDG